MAYICLKCSHIFEEGEQTYRNESRGEYWGTSCHERVSGCPLCNGEYEESVACEICGSEHLEEDLNGGACDECIAKYKYDADMCLKIGASDTEDVKLNCFLASMFEKEDIENILFKELKNREKYIKDYMKDDYDRFVCSDISWFAERLAEEVKKSEQAKG